MRKPTLPKVLLAILVRLACATLAGVALIYLCNLGPVFLVMVAAILVTYGLLAYGIFVIVRHLRMYRRFVKGPPAAGRP